MSDIWKATDALQNARDHLVIARASRGVQREHDIEAARENVRDAMKCLGIKEDANNENDR